MVITEKTEFGMMFGDNNGLIMDYRMLAEMLLASGRKEDRNYYNQEARSLQERLDKLTWNGRHYVHFVPEDPAFLRKETSEKRRLKTKFHCLMPTHSIVEFRIYECSEF